MMTGCFCRYCRYFVVWQELPVTKGSCYVELPPILQGVATDDRLTGVNETCAFWREKDEELSNLDRKY